MKKIVFAALAALAFAGSAFAEVTLNFYNKVYEDDVVWAKAGKDETGYVSALGIPADETWKDFPAIKERMFVELESDQVDAMIKATVYYDDFDEKHFGVEGLVNDWYVEFRPVEIVTLGLHDNIFSTGSYLPIYDDNLQGGNIGSDGFSVIVRPNQFNKAFRFAFTVPFSFEGWDVNYVNGTEEDGEDKFHFGAGIIFTLPQVELGATLKNPNDSDFTLIGVSAAFPTLFGLNEGLNVGVGFTYDKTKEAGYDDLIMDFAGITGEQLVNAFVSYEKDAISVTAEVLYAIDQEDYEGELYTAVNFGYAVNEKLGLGCTAKLLTVKDTSNLSWDPVWSAGVNADYQLDDHNSFGAGFEFMNWGGAEWKGAGKYEGISGIKVPVYWKWSL